MYENLFMRVYVYDWNYVVRDNITYYIGYGIKEDNERVSVINSTHMKCFYVKQYALDKLVAKLNASVYDFMSFIKCEHTITPIVAPLLRSGYGIYERLYAICIQDCNVFSRFVAYLKNYKIHTYEDELDPITEFLNRQDLHYTGWVDIKECYEVTDGILTTTREYYFKSDDVKASDYEIVPSMRILCVDTETYSPNEFKVPLAHNPQDEVRLIGTVLKDGASLRKASFIVSDKDIEVDGVEVYRYSTQYDMIKGYIDYLRKVSPEIIIGYNHLSYDYAFLVDRYIFTHYWHPSYSRLRGHDLKAKRVTWSSSAFQNNDFWMFDVPGVIDIDLMQYVVKEQGYKGHSLNQVAAQVLGESKIDLDYHMIHKYFADNDIKGMGEIIHYCIQDCELPIKIFEKNLVRVGILERAKVERVSPNHIYTLGSAARMVGQLHYQCKGKYILDTCSETREAYQGAVVMTPEVGIYEHCATVDFSSLYPSIIISENICYTTYVPEHRRIASERYNYIHLNGKNITFLKNPVGIVPKLLMSLIQQRKEAKQKMKVAPIPEIAQVWDKRQWAYKIVANSIYGLMGSNNPHLMFPTGAACVTNQGRVYLQKTKQLLSEQDDVTVIYGDTDSCFIQVMGLDNPSDIEVRCKELCAYITKCMENKVNLEYENSFKKLLIIAKKSYIAQRYTGTYYYRGGEIVKRNRSQFLRRMSTELIEHAFDHGIDAAKQYVEQQLKNLLDGKIPVDDLKIGMLINENTASTEHKAMLKHMEKHAIFYKPNERLYYVYVTGCSSGATHTSKRRDVRWVVDTGAKIDFRAHITHEIKNPVLKITKVLGIKHIANLN